MESMHEENRIRNENSMNVIKGVKVEFIKWYIYLM